MISSGLRDQIRTSKMEDESHLEEKVDIEDLVLPDPKDDSTDVAACSSNTIKNEEEVFPSSSLTIKKESDIEETFEEDDQNHEDNQELPEVDTMKKMASVKNDRMENPEICAECGIRFGNKKILSIHKSLVHKYDISDSAVPISTKQLKRKRSMQTKTDDSRPGKVPKVAMENNKINVSDASFTENPTLKGHISSVHEKKKPHKCTICDASFSQNGNLKTHNSSCLLYTSPSPRDGLLSRMPSSA